jgi:hypothetical protein
MAADREALEAVLEDIQVVVVVDLLMVADQVAVAQEDQVAVSPAVDRTTGVDQEDQAELQAFNQAPLEADHWATIRATLPRSQLDREGLVAKEDRAALATATRTTNVHLARPDHQERRANLACQA